MSTELTFCMSWLTVLFISIYCGQTSYGQISPTTSNSTGDFFITSDYTEDSTSFFRWDSIECKSSFCHIICDELSGCYGLKVNASLATSLIIECNTYKSCYNLELIAPTSSVDIYCHESQSCYNGIIYADFTDNIYLECNYNLSSSICTGSTSNDIGCSCYGLSLHSTQSIKTRVYCSDYDCQETKFYLTNTNQSSFNFTGNQTARYSKIYAYYINYLDIECNGDSSCYYTDINATNTVNGISVTCHGNNACNSVNFYCPDSSWCNIDCLSVTSCEAANFHIDNPLTEYFNLNCAINGACPSTEIYCDDKASTTSSYLVWDTINLQYKCNSYACCPINRGDITCAAGTDCQIDCWGITCNNYHIDGRKATSLTVNCRNQGSGTNGCKGSIIECPISDLTSCNIQCTDSYSCQYAYITTGNNNTMNNLVLDCIGTSSCDHTTLSVISTNIINLDINCDGTSSCIGSSISIYSMIDTLGLSCIGSSGCNGLDINIGSLSIGTVSWNCTSTSSCNAAKMRLTDNEKIDWLYLLCTASSSCRTLQIAATTATIVNLDIDCKNQAGTCMSMDIDATIGNSVDIDCVVQEACEQANFALTAVTSGVNVDIECANPSITTSSLYGACNTAYFYIYGYLDSDGNKDNNVSVKCSQYDCYNGEIYAYNVNNVTADCDDPHSCQYGTINAASAGYLHLNCNNFQSCYQTDVYCPYRKEKTCKIDCSTQGSSCSYMNIHVPSSYMYDYLDIYCPSEEIYSSKSCTGLDITCDDGTRSTAYFSYDSMTANDYTCGSYTGTSYCCPYFSGNKITCTAGMDCTQYCGYNSNCADSLIDGTAATSLTVNCDGSYDCQGTVIDCPAAGCTIVCQSYGCYQTQISYNGELSDKGKISVKCSGTYGCFKLVMNAQYAYQIDIECLSSNNNNYGVCNAVAVNAQNANEINIFANETYAIHKGNWNMNMAKTVKITAKGYSAIYNGYFHAENADSMMITCSIDDSGSNNYACYNPYWYLPYNTTYNCYGFGCNYLGQLYVSNISGLQMNVNLCAQCSNIGDCVSSFTLYCGWDGYSYSYTQSYQGNSADNDDCNVISVGNTCGCTELIENITYHDDITDYEQCYDASAPVSCPVGDDCTVYCSSTNCANTIIDGSMATHLTVKCNGNYYCQYAVIKCPSAGCSIECSDDYSCEGANIIHDGNSTDFGSVSLKCEQSYSCHQTVLNATYADILDISCKAGRNSYDYVCYYLTVDAKHANIVNIISNEEYGNYYSNYYLQNVTTITLNARGPSAWYYSNMYAQNAGSLAVTCTSEDYTYSCYKGAWYIPYNASFNCYGQACGLTDIYLKHNVSALNISINACGECDGIDECLSSMTLWCGDGYSLKENYYTYQGCSTSTSTVTDCGCTEIIEKIEYFDSATDDNCYSPSPFTTQQLYYIICGSAGAVLCLCILCCCWCKYASKSKRYTPSYQPTPIISPPMNISPVKSASFEPVPQNLPFQVPATKQIPIMFVARAQPVPPTVGATTDNVQLSQIQPAVPSAPSAASVYNADISPAAIPSAPGMDNEQLPQYDDVKNAFVVEAPPPAYGNVGSGGENDGESQPVYNKVVSKEGGNQVTNM